MSGNQAAKGSKSQLSRAFAEDGAVKTHVGGQALLEGIMMRGKRNWAVAVRKPDGSMHLEEHDLPSGKEGRGWLSWPLVRGVTALVESLALGFKALEIAAAHAFGEEEEEKKLDREADELVDMMEGELTTDASVRGGGPGKGIVPSAEDPSAKVEGGLANDGGATLAKTDEGALSKGAMTASMVFGVVLGIAVFLALPAVLTNLVVGEYDSSPVLWNVVDGVIRVAIFIAYIWLIGRMEDIRRMFMYHGAEHKTIHCFEHGLELTPENARAFPRLHVRCGTAFLIMVLLIAIVVYTLIPLNALIAALGVPDGLPKLALVIAIRIVLLPVIAGISYEITVKWAGSHPENPLVKVILWPGMQMQYLTTNEPDDGNLECAIAAMRLVLEREREVR